MCVCVCNNIQNKGMILITVGNKSFKKYLKFKYQEITVTNWNDFMSFHTMYLVTF
jgi:hypothetical protein